MIDTKEIRKALAIHGVDALNVNEVLDVLDHLEAADKEIESWKGVAKQLGNDADTLRTHLSFAKDELNRLRAKIAEMENQEPVKIQHHVPFANSNGELVGYSVWIDGRGFDHWPHRSLYLAPGAQPAPTSSVGARKVTRDFRWDAAMQCHVPTLKVEFEPVHIDEPSDAKGWQDQDRIAAMLEAAPESKL